MRLLSLSLPEFKNLRNFDLDFDDTELITVFLGGNGTGKTNLFEALILIFRDADLNRVPTFPFTLSYASRGKVIELTGRPEARSGRFRVRVDGERLNLRDFRREADRFLPDHVFAYYSGPSNRLEQHFESHESRYLAALLQGDPRALRRLFYARAVHSQFVLLAFFSVLEDVGTQFLAEYFGIDALESVRFVLHEPDWSRGRAKQSRTGDERFWHARGLVADFLSRLYDLSLAPVSTTEPGTRRELLNLHLATPENLRELAAQYESQAEFFAALESTYLSDLVHNVEIKVRKDGLDEAITFDELSEGEQQLLTVLGLLRFTARREAIFLLDEPDTHLNPSWSYDYLSLLRHVSPQDESTQILLATHDPVMIGGLVRQQVRVMQADTLTHTSAATPPEQDPKGMGVAGLLTSELFRLKSTVDVETLEKIDERIALWGNANRTVDEQRQYDQLTRELANLGFNYEHADPYQAEFSAALQRYFSELTSSLTIEERKQLDDEADKMLTEVLDETDEMD